MRKHQPWVGKTDDAAIPLQVQLRVLERQNGRCAVSGRKFAVGDAKHLDHKIALADGGRHTEANLQWILASEHKAKTSDEATQRATVRRVSIKHAGLKPKAEKPEKKPLTKMALGVPALARRGFVPAGGQS